MKPPVDAPASRRADPRHIDGEIVERTIELFAASADESSRWARDDDGVTGGHLPRGLVGDRPVHQHTVVGDQRLCLGAARHETSSEEFGVEPTPGSHRPSGTGARRRSLFRWRLLGRRLLGWRLLRWRLLRRRLLGRGLLRRGLLRRGLLGWAPSWPAPSRAFLAGAFLAGAFVAVVTVRDATTDTAGLRCLLPELGRERFEAVLEFVESFREPADLLGHLALHVRRNSLRRLAALDRRSAARSSRRRPSLTSPA